MRQTRTVAEWRNIVVNLTVKGYIGAAGSLAVKIDGMTDDQPVEIELGAITQAVNLVAPPDMTIDPLRIAYEKVSQALARRITECDTEECGGYKGLCTACARAAREQTDADLLISS